MKTERSEQIMVGHDAEFSRVFQQYRNTVFSIAFNYLKNTADANDVTQDVFVKYLRCEKPFNDEEHIKAWLIRVTINTAKSLLASSWFCKTEPIDEEITSNDNSEQSELLISVMKLPEKYRIVIHLFYYEGYSTKEISEILRINESTVRVRLMRAREKLKETLEEVTT